MTVNTTFNDQYSVTYDGMVYSKCRHPKKPDPAVFLWYLWMQLAPELLEASVDPMDAATRYSGCVGE